MLIHKKSDKKRELLLRKNNLTSNILVREYNIKKEEIRNEANKKGTLQSGLFDAAFMRNELEKAEKLLQDHYNNFKSVYCRRGFIKKYAADFFETLSQWEKNNHIGFSHAVDGEHCISHEMKPQLKERYARELQIILSRQRSIVEIEVRERDMKIKDEYGAPLKIERIFYRISSLWEESKIKAVGLVIFLLFVSYSTFRQAYEVILALSKIY